MSGPIKPGERVHLTVRSRQPIYRPGDKSVVLEGPRTTSDGEEYYIVQMGDGPPFHLLIFMSDEIDRDE